MTPKQIQHVLQTVKNPLKVVSIRLGQKWAQLLFCDIERIDWNKVKAEDIRIHTLCDKNGWISVFHEEQVYTMME